MCVTALAIASVAVAQPAPRVYLQGVAGQTRAATAAGVFGAGLGISVTPDIRIGVEGGRITDIVPKAVTARVGDLLPAEPGLQITPRMPAVYTTGSVGYILPLKSRVQPYLDESVGIVRFTAELDVRGTGPIAQAIRAELASNGQTAAVTRLLTRTGGGIIIRLTRELRAEVGYRHMKVFGNDIDIQAHQLHTALTVGL
jgi:hypothetical protein